MSCVTQVPPRFKTGFAYGTVTLCGHGFHRVPLPFSSTCWRSYNPDRALPLCRFRLLRVRSPLLAESLLFSFPAGNEMFQFPAFASFTDTDLCRWVAPFGYPRINGYLPLPAAFRSLSRPSSPPRATGIPHAPFFVFLLFSPLRSSKLALRSSLVTLASDSICCQIVSLAFPSCQCPLCGE